MTQGTVLVTGARGFTGRYLTEYLRRGSGREVVGTTLGECPGVQACDLGDRQQVRELLMATRPAQIYHCAGSFSNSWDEDFKSNVLTGKNIFDVILELQLPCRTLLVGSAAEYGLTPCGPVPESAPLRPISVYGLTKALQTSLMEFYGRNHRLDIVMARAFNLFGEGCKSALFPGRVLEQIHALKSGRLPTIKVGPLGSKRDYLSVERAVEDYVRIMERGVSGEIYNVGSGAAVKLSDFLAQLLETHGLTMDVVEMEAAAGGQKAEVTEICADVAKLKALA